MFRPRLSVLVPVVLLCGLTLTACSPADQPVEQLPTSRSIEGLPMLEQVLERAGLPVERLENQSVYESTRVELWLAGGEPLWVAEGGSGSGAIEGELREHAGRDALIWRGANMMVAYSGSDGGVRLVLEALLGDPIGGAPIGQDEPFPPAVLAALRAVGEQTQRDLEEISVIGFSERQWPDSCLGLPAPEPGTSCVPGELAGWLITFQVDERLVRVRTDALGDIIQMESPNG